MKGLDPLRAKKIFIRKKLGHTVVSAIKTSSVTLKTWPKKPAENTVYLHFFYYGSRFKDSYKSKITKIFRICSENESKRMINSELSEYIS